ncbi:putative beta-lysine N-acetyltransferase [bacterium]|nr:putative beta-lysine N-acetyltransferase [bacterium]
MAEWIAVLPDGSKRELDQPYGVDTAVQEPGLYEAKVTLSPLNERIQVKEYDAENYGKMVTGLKVLAAANDYGKIWIKARASEEEELTLAGFEREAVIPGFFDGEDAVSMAIFPKGDRRERPQRMKEDDILENACSGFPRADFRPLPEGYVTSLFTPDDAEDLAKLYEEVFPTYPYPITEPDYLRETAASHIIYRIIRNEAGELVAAASAETMPAMHNSEMTDFASRPSERGKGLAQFLLRALEEDAKERFDIRYMYTIARAQSFGMLRTFHNCGYAVSGTLVNNCNISGQFETMHVFYRK